MAQSIQEVMTRDPVTVEGSSNLEEVARAMRDNDTGAILVTEGGQVRGIVTDRDIVVRAVADGRDAGTVPAAELSTENVVTLSLEDTVERAIELMREHDIRRLPVVDGDGRPAGIVSIGDLAIERDEDSALADMSAAPPNN